MGGYSAVKNEFETCLRQITMLGYGIILIAHSEKRVETIDGNETEFFSPALNKRCYEICNRLVDIIGYIAIEWNEDGTSERYLYTRQTPHVVAGSRFQYLAPKIKFGYEELVAAVGEAIDKSEANGAVVVDHQEARVVEHLDFTTVRNRALELWNKLVLSDPENPNEDMARRALKRVEVIFGRPIKLSEITEDQVDLFNLAVLEMEDLFNEFYGIQPM